MPCLPLIHTGSSKPMLSSSSPYAAFQPHEQPLEDSASSLQGNVSLIRYNRTHSWLSVCNNRSSPCSHMKAAVDMHRQQAANVCACLTVQLSTKCCLGCLPRSATVPGAAVRFCNSYMYTRHSKLSCVKDRFTFNCILGVGRFNARELGLITD